MLVLVAHPKIKQKVYEVSSVFCETAHVVNLHLLYDQQHIMMELVCETIKLISWLTTHVNNVVADVNQVQTADILIISQLESSVNYVKHTNLVVPFL